MVYSYTQIRQYLTCPRRYRYRYLDSWQEKDTRAVMLFGPAFEPALGARRIQSESGSASGLRARTSGCTIQMATPGNACCSKTSCSWTASAKMTVSESINRGAACRSSSRDQSALVHKAGVDLGRFDELSF